ncbi:formamidopyrimidine-DNA glycosylase [Sediminihabitans luteus]|uniref:Formamidopyrimidine-DNA glycosylase n=1 Tax=Sediminihabitans luteus TaxID=1138585 RepID=A0A2M9CCE1_9CELL|nr:DNA-formamidopyrimidine glycosylase family protein [Sediminihabitans luteus]PJJ69009.1 formamidopyrimidine-DNA glycosylase [Sediminihabitans luteus]GII99393.1 formamidopyrimidine-DNA glycosylase [Sediminihabitans luteus]
MPELPEVASLVEFLDERTAGRAVVAADVASIAALKTFSPPVDALVGRRVAGVRRHGKWIDVELAPGPDGTDDAGLHLLVHLSLGGWVRWSATAPTGAVRPSLGGRSRGPALALRVRLDDGSGFDLTEAGTRKRLAVHVVRAADDVPAVASLGVDPLGPGFTPEVLARVLAARNQQVKGALRDQSAIAGIGNAYSDEILHAARTSPFRMTRTYADDPAGVEALHGAVRSVLAEAVAASSGKPAAELKDAKRRGMRVHGRTGQACPGWDGTPCGDVVHEVAFADRSLQYCPTCQTGGRVLADRRMSRLLR